ncbi:MAG: hypothetical protein Q9221_002825 [Calogaya cf. arnoldii]
MSTIPLRILLLAISLSSLVETTIAQQDSTPQNPTKTNSTANCTTVEHFGPNGDTYNGSASYPIFGFYPPGTGSVTPLNWTYNIAVIVDNNGESEHSFWIDGLWAKDLESKDLPYYGCVTAFLDLPRSTVERGLRDRGDCTRTFDDDCVRETLENARQRALSFNTTGNDQVSDVCRLLMRGTLGSSCNQYTGDAEGLVSTGSAVSNDGIGNSTYSNGTDASGCPNHKKGANRSLLSWGHSGARNNETAYDRAITGVTPILTVVFPKQNSTIDPGWTDARFVCMRPGEMEVGSRVPEGVPAEESLGVRTITGSMALSVAFVLGIGLVGML